ncbi:MAG: cobalamin-dependent protein [Bacteroidales bacterium]|nr:cobalamin-dependent protein [Bacteroidales bacterium]
MIDLKTYNNYFNSLIKGDKNKCLEIFTEIINNNVPIQNIYTDLFQQSLYQVGEYWEMNKISVATEHMATAITESLMIRLHPQIFSTEKTGKKAVIACVANEHHQVGAKMVADIFEINGWDGYFVGANTPINELIRFLENKNPDLIGLSLSVYFNMPELKSALIKIRQHFPSLPVMVGGQAFRWGGSEIAGQFNNITYLSGIDTLSNFIKQ